MELQGAHGVQGRLLAILGQFHALATLAHLRGLDPIRIEMTRPPTDSDDRIRNFQFANQLGARASAKARSAPPTELSVLIKCETRASYM